MDPIVNALVNFGIGGCMAAGVLWLVWYRETVAIPKMFASFAEQMHQEREDNHRRHQENREDIRLLVQGFGEISQAVRDTHHDLRTLCSLLRLRADYEAKAGAGPRPGAATDPEA